MNKKILHTFFFAPIVAVDKTHKMSRMIGNSGKPFFWNNHIITIEKKYKLKPSILLTAGKIEGFKLSLYDAHKNILSGVNYQQTNVLFSIY